MAYHLMLLSLAHNAQPDLHTKEESRKNYLATIFSTAIVFEHRSNEYLYHPEGRDGNLYFGFITQPKDLVAFDGPASGFAQIIHPSWEHAFLVVDTTSDASGQRMAVEHRPTVGQPLSLVRSMVDHLNEQRPAPSWIISANPIADPEGFWDVATRRADEITELSFILSVPNSLGIEDALQADMKEIGTDTHAKEVEIALKGKGGRVSANGRIVKSLVKATSAGQGSNKIKAKKKTIYDSKQRIKKVNIVEPAEVSILDGALALFRALRP